MATADSKPQKAIIGNPLESFWLYDSELGFDLTHPPSPTNPLVSTAVKFNTSTLPISIDPAKSALVVIDMQNFFLSTSLGRLPDSKGLKAQNTLLEYAIPAARKAGIRILWMNWGLTQDDIENMPPAILRIFGFETVEAIDFESHVKSVVDQAEQSGSKPDVESSGKDPRIYKGIGKQLGFVKLEDGQSIDAGRLLMRDQWNTDLTPELSKAYQEGLKANPPDVWFHKNRMSGLWGPSNECTDFLDKQGIRTLLFAGVNTDQCVGGSLQDAFTKGYDCILLTDGAATTSPEFGQQCVEFNTTKGMGFCSTCKSLWEGVRESLVSAN